ncbi:MFS transporter, partial [Sinorhizobium meliloti]
MFDFARDNLLFIRKNTRWIGAWFLLTLFSSFGQTFFIGLSGNELRNTFHLSGGEFGGLYMLATLASAVTLPWLGRTLDLMPGWKVVRFSMAGLALACVLIAFAPNIAVLALAIYLLRLFGQGMMTEIALTEVGRWFVANRGRAMALITQGQQVGSAILPAAVVGITQLSGSWRAGWFVSAAAVVLIGLPAIVSLMRVERLPHSHEAKAARLRAAREWTRGEVIRDPILYILLAGTLAPAFIGTVIFFH